MPYNSNIYDLQWSRLLRWLLPTMLRRERLMIFLNALALPLNDIHTRFLYFRMGIQYKLKITPQVCYLEKALNDRYDVVLRRIYIDDAPEYLPVAFFTRAENKPVPIYTKAEGPGLVFYTKSETAQFGVDFIIMVPADLVFIMAELRAFVTGYKLTTKKFGVQTF